MAGAFRIGTSGWHYDHWREVFYPADLRADAYLSFYAASFDSVEINASFYRLPTRETFTAWAGATPDGFLFAVKASRYITHMKKLKDPEESTDRFLAALEGLEGKLGPVLFQLPPHWHVNLSRLEEFLATLPKGLRAAFEFRDPSWFTPRVMEALAARNAAFCIFDLAGETSPLAVTADFVYLRLHGPDGPYRGTYDDAALRQWAKRIAEWRGEGRDVFCYFDNDEAGYAVRDARRLRALVEG